MARTKQEINSKSRERLKRICEDLHITQKRLSEATGISENTLSKIATGRGPLTRQIAEEIIKACPSYRIEWLMGFDDKPHETEMIKIHGIETLTKCLSAIEFLSAAGIEIGQVTAAGVFLPASKTRGFVFEDRSAEVRRGDDVIWIGSIQTIENTLLEICAFSLFKIELLKNEWRV